MQYFRNFPLYMTGELWNLVEGADTTVSQLRKIEMLCTYLVNSLGLRHASEPTQSVMVALVCRRTDAAQQSALLQTIKGVLKTTTTRAKQTGSPLPGNIYLEQLPAGQDQLPAPYRAQFFNLGYRACTALRELGCDLASGAGNAVELRNRNQQLVSCNRLCLGKVFPRWVRWQCSSNS